HSIGGCEMRRLLLSLRCAGSGAPARVRDGARRTAPGPCSRRDYNPLTPGILSSESLGATGTPFHAGDIVCLRALFAARRRLITAHVACFPWLPAPQPT